MAANNQQQQTHVDPITAWGNLNTPYSQEAEEATLGAIIINPMTYYDVAHFLQADDFFILRHRYIYQAIELLIERGEPIDYLTLSEALKNNGKLPEIGGPAYLTQLCNAPPTSSHASVYAHLVERAALRRKLMAFSDDARGLALQEEITVSDVITEIESKLMDITSRVTGDSTKTLGEAVSGYYDHIDKLINSNGEAVGISTGLKDLDFVLKGLGEQSFTLLGGRPGMGKSSASLTFALNMAKAGIRVAYFTLEMSVEEMTGRVISMQTGINTQKLKTGNLSAAEISAFTKASSDLQNLPLFIDDTVTWTPQQLRAKCMSMRRRNGIEIIFIDHVGLMSGGGRYKDNRVAESSFISVSLKGIARSIKVPVWGAIQLNRELEKRQDKRPQLSDLRETGAWEQDADNVIFMYRDEMYNEATEFPNQVDFIIAKQRSGPIGTVSAYFEKTTTAIQNAAQRSVDLSHIGRNWKSEKDNDS
jgi:replicative DNA helicase